MSKRSKPPYERFGKATPLEDARLRIHVWREGDRLSVLAEQYLDDWRLWRVIADRSKITDPRKIAVGTELIVPEIPLEKGIYEST
ncbi:MAG TPA: hypothetical protein VF648_07045 [Pyrinomonadaceae bacterium]|jgi:nucleoid-associated protein YgaU